MVKIPSNIERGPYDKLQKEIIQQAREITLLQMRNHVHS